MQLFFGGGSGDVRRSAAALPTLPDIGSAGWLSILSGRFSPRCHYLDYECHGNEDYATMSGPKCLCMLITCVVNDVVSVAKVHATPILLFCSKILVSPGRAYPPASSIVDQCMKQSDISTWHWSNMHFLDKLRVSTVGVSWYRYSQCKQNIAKGLSVSPRVNN